MVFEWVSFLAIELTVFSLMLSRLKLEKKVMARMKKPSQKLPKKATATRPVALAREKTEGRIVGGKFSQLATYSDLFERANDGILLVDLRNYEVLETNSAFRDLVEADRSPEGMLFTEFFPEEDETKVQAWLKGKSEEGIEVETSFGKWLEFTRAKVKLADYCEVYQVIVRDVTAEKSKRNALEKQSLTDEMTGLSNLRSFRSRLALEHERAQVKKQKYAVLFLDVDNFKHYNDRNGHPAGDGALKQVAAILRDCAGRSEFVARYGGEEFVVLCSNANAAQGGAFAEKLRKAIESSEFAHGAAQPLGRVTVSIGVSEFAGDAKPDSVLKRADEALYRSKKEGRNRVTIDTPAMISGEKIA